MRGAGNAKRRRKSSCTISRVARRRSAVIARGTSASAKWVVTSATRNEAFCSIMTGSAAPASRREIFGMSVKSKPASMSVLFCTGAVTMAANSPRMQPSQARSSMAMTEAALRGSSRPATTGCAVGTSRSLSVPAREGRRAERVVDARRPALRRAPRPSPRASFASPATTRSAGQSLRASATQASGPIPAGSPEVTTMRGTSHYILISTNASSRSRRSHSSVSSSALLSRIAAKAFWRRTSSVLS